MSELNEIERGQLCQSTIEALYEAKGGLSHFPKLMKKLIETKAWERRLNKGKVIELKSLRELITEKPIRGWGEDPKKVEAIIKDDADCLAMFREAMKEQGKRNDLGDIIPEVKRPERSTSKAYTCERLKKQAPELFEEVKAGRMSANAAAIQAGIRKKPTPENQCIKAWGKIENRIETLKAIVESLSETERELLKEFLNP
jgi:primosomal protein N''